MKMLDVVLEGVRGLLQVVVPDGVRGLRHRKRRRPLCCVPGQQPREQTEAQRLKAY